MRVVSTRVLPLPAPARISADACGSVTASSCSGLRLARSGEDTGTTIIGDRYNPPPHERGPTIRAEGPSRGANCAPWGAAQRRKPQAWGDHIRAEGPSRGANCAPWGAAQRRKPQAWGDVMPRAPDDTPPVNSATMRAFVHWIRAAAPYVHAFRGKTFVIAFGGEVVADDSFLGVVHDLNLLHSLGIRIIVAHGCRPQVEAILAAQNIESRYANGVRITDNDTMDCVLEAAGQVRARIEA